MVRKQTQNRMHIIAWICSPFGFIRPVAHRLTLQVVTIQLSGTYYGGLHDVFVMLCR